MQKGAAAHAAPFGAAQLKPFPLRACFSVDAAHGAAVAVARVDASRNAVRDLIYHTQMPLQLTLRPHSALLDDASVARTTNALRMLCGAVAKLEGVSERAGLLSWPFNAAANGTQVAAAWAREMKIDFRCVPLSKAEDGGEGQQPHGSEPAPRAFLEFVSHAAAAANVAMERMLVIAEAAPEAEGGGGISVFGIEPGAVQEGREGALARSSRRSTADVAGGGEVLELGHGRWRLQRFDVPVTSRAAHRMLHTVVQRRDPAAFEPFKSCNPARREEFAKLRAMLLHVVARSVPTWLKEKAALGGAIVGTSIESGLMLNVAARVAGQQDVTLDRLEAHAEYRYCGLTDVLMGENFRAPHLVLPQAALCAALMRALGTPRIQYLPEVSLAIGGLALPQLWASSRAAAIQQQLDASPWAQNTRLRVANAPHQALHRDNPNAAPNTPAFKLKKYRRGDTSIDVL